MQEKYKLRMNLKIESYILLKRLMCFKNIKMLSAGTS